MQNFKLFLLSALLLFSLSGCQGNNSDSQSAGDVPVVEDTNSSKAIVVLPTNSVTLTTNSQTVGIDVYVYDATNNPYETGTVKRINPDLVLQGKDVGTFDKNSAEIVNGVASFVYTGPKDLKSLDYSELEFSFYHDSNISTAKTFTVKIDTHETKQVVLTDYFLKTSAPGLTMNLNSSESVSYTIYDADNVSLPDENIYSIKITSKNADIATLSDSFGVSGSSITLENKNSMSVNIDTKRLSGLVDIEVEASFRDYNDVNRTIKETFGVVVFSGPPTAMSFTYAGTDKNTTTNKFVERWVLTVTDSYNNRVNTNPVISTGLITGYAQTSGTPKNVAGYLFNEQKSDAAPLAGGTLKNASPDVFVAQEDVFTNVDLDHDKLVLFGEGYVFNASGKWDIDTKVSGNTLSLLDDYNGTDTSGLGFAVGHNFRNETCSGNSVVANVYTPDGDNRLKDYGSMDIMVEYDDYLVGKDVMLWANFLGEHNNENARIGNAEKITLRGNGLQTSTYAFAAGFTGTVRFDISIKDSSRFYQNANFGYIAQVTGDGVSWEYAGDSMSDHDITSCAYNGVGYVDITITNGGDGGTITITDLLVSSEF